MRALARRRDACDMLRSTTGKINSPEEKQPPCPPPARQECAHARSAGSSGPCDEASSCTFAGFPRAVSVPKCIPGARSIGHPEPTACTRDAGGRPAGRWCRSTMVEARRRVVRSCTPDRHRLGNGGTRSSSGRNDPRHAGGPVSRHRTVATGGRDNRARDHGCAGHTGRPLPAGRRNHGSPSRRRPGPRGFAGARAVAGRVAA
jgi:hypothetical protein